MSKLQDRIQESIEQVTALNAKVEDDTITDEELVQLEELNASLEVDTKKLSASNNSNALIAQVNKPQRKVVQPDGPVASFEQEDEPQDAIPARALAHGKLKAFDDSKTAYRAYHWLRAAKLGDQNSINWCQRNHVELHAANLVEGTDSAGGALVPTEFIPALIKNVTNYGVFRKYAKNVPMVRDVAEYAINQGGLAFEFVDEATAPSGQTKDVYAKATLTAKACAADVPISRELIADAAISVVDDVFDSAARGLALAEDTQGFLGTGSPFTGIATRLSGTSGGDLDYEASTVETTGTFADLTLTEWTSLSSQLPHYEGVDEPKLFISKSGFNQWLDALMLEAGGNTAAILASKTSQMFNGFEVVFTEVLPKASDTIGAYDVLALFGYLDRACAFGERESLNFNVSEHYRANTREISVFPWARFAINCHDTGTAGLKDGAGVAGPMQALIYTAS